MLLKTLEILAELEKEPAYAAKAKACACILMGMVPGFGTPQAMEIERAASHIQETRQAYASANR